MCRVHANHTELLHGRHHWACYQGTSHDDIASTIPGEGVVQRGDAWYVEEPEQVDERQREGFGSAEQRKCVEGDWLVHK